MVNGIESEPVGPIDSSGPEMESRAPTPEITGNNWIDAKLEAAGKSLDGFFSTASTREAEEGPSARVGNALMKIWGVGSSLVGGEILAHVNPAASRPENTAAILGLALFATGIVAIQRAWVDSMKAKGYIPKNE